MFSLHFLPFRPVLSVSGEEQTLVEGMRGCGMQQLSLRKMKEGDLFP